MTLEKDCQGYLEAISDAIEGKMGFGFSNWDNRDGSMANFECAETCPSPASSCDSSISMISDFRVETWGYTEDKPDNNDDNDNDDDDGGNDGDDGDEDESFEPAMMHAFIAYAEDFEEDTYEFYVRGLDGRDLTTQDRAITMGSNNRAFILDFPYDDTCYWAYEHFFLGGSMSYDVDVSQVSCDRAAGLFLVQMDDEDCSWFPQPSDYVPQCASLDVMTANKHGFAIEAHPCEFGQCDNESLCKARFTDEDYWNYGYGADFMINTENPFNV